MLASGPVDPRADLCEVGVRGSATEFAIRSAEPEDAPACHEMRRNAFLEVFSRYMGETLTAAGAEAYTTEEFAEHLADMPTSVAVIGGEPVGFCTVRRRDDREAELLWLYVRLDHLRRGIGSKLARHAEELALSSFPGISRMVLVTGVTDYNQAFYERLGYREVGREEIQYPTASAFLVKLGKRFPADRRRRAE